MARERILAEAMKTEPTGGSEPASAPARRDLADWSRWLASAGFVIAVLTVPIVAIGGRSSATGNGPLNVALGTLVIALVLALAALACGYLARGKRLNAASKRDGVAMGWAILLISGLNVLNLPLFVRTRHTGSKSACVNNLHALQLAKQQWAKDHHKKPADIPTLDDLVGTNKYITGWLVCPAYGIYSPNSVTNKPTCSLNEPGHRYEPDR